MEQGVLSASLTRAIPIAVAQVRLSYPTAAVAQMVKSGALPLTGAANGVPDNVHAFLTKHQGDFEIRRRQTGYPVRERRQLRLFACSQALPWHPDPGK